MKNLTTKNIRILGNLTKLVFASSLLLACTGPSGGPGPQGQPGADGPEGRAGQNQGPTKRDGVGRGGGSFTQTDSEILLKQVRSDLKGILAKSGEDAYSDLGEGWDKKAVREILENLIEAPDEIVERSDGRRVKSLSFDYDSKDHPTGPKIKVLKGFYDSFAHVEMIVGKDYDIAQTKTKVIYKLFYELSHIVLNHPKGDLSAEQVDKIEEEAAQFAQKMVKRILTPIVVCQEREDEDQDLVYQWREAELTRASANPNDGESYLTQPFTWSKGRATYIFYPERTAEIFFINGKEKLKENLDQLSIENLRPNDLSYSNFNPISRYVRGFKSKKALGPHFFRDEMVEDSKSQRDLDPSGFVYANIFPTDKEMLNWVYDMNLGGREAMRSNEVDKGARKYLGGRSGERVSAYAYSDGDHLIRPKREDLTDFQKVANLFKTHVAIDKGWRVEVKNLNLFGELGNQVKVENEISWNFTEYSSGFADSGGISEGQEQRLMEESEKLFKDIKNPAFEYEKFPEKIEGKAIRYPVRRVTYKRTQDLDCFTYTPKSE